MRCVPLGKHFELKIKTACMEELKVKKVDSYR